MSSPQGSIIQVRGKGKVESEVFSERAAIESVEGEDGPPWGNYWWMHQTQLLRSRPSWPIEIVARGPIFDIVRPPRVSRMAKRGLLLDALLHLAK